MFKIAEKRMEGRDTQFTRWKKILPAPSTTKSIDIPSIKGHEGTKNFV